MARQIRGVNYADVYNRVVSQYGSAGVQFRSSSERRALDRRFDQVAQQINQERTQATTQRAQIQKATQTAQAETKRLKQETLGIQEQIKEETQALEALKTTRRRTNRSALQPSSNLFSLLGGSQNGRSTLG